MTQGGVRQAFHTVEELWDILQRGGEEGEVFTSTTWPMFQAMTAGGISQLAKRHIASSADI
jgi:hypothetical protein